MIDLKLMTAPCAGASLGTFRSILCWQVNPSAAEELSVCDNDAFLEGERRVPLNLQDGVKMSHSLSGSAEGPILT